MQRQNYSSTLLMGLSICLLIFNFMLNCPQSSYADEDGGDGGTCTCKSSCEYDDNTGYCLDHNGSMFGNCFDDVHFKCNRNQCECAGYEAVGSECPCHFEDAE